MTSDFVSHDILVNNLETGGSDSSMVGSMVVFTILKGHECG